MHHSLKLVYNELGSPSEVLQLIESEIPDPAPDQVLIELVAATINPSDYGMIQGSYGSLRNLPAVAGREGVGKIIALGTAVTDYQLGDHVVIPPELGCWQTRLLAPAPNLRIIPKDIPVEMAAMLTVNPPTAWRILRDAYLPPNAWVIQNAANSAVGIFVIQMAKHLGLKTLNVVRRPELINPLKALGADCVVTEDSGFEKQIKELTNGGNCLLALNSIGGESASRLIKSLNNGGTMVTFGAMSFEATRFPTRYLIFNDIKLTGFWMDRWYRENPWARQQIMFENLYGLIRDQTITAPVAQRFPLAQFKEALVANSSPKMGKVLLVNE